ncbi:MAG TPA: glycosyltransferase, partial [Candidatus Polarisedimenticolia bacterium]|nr:glycosyltransferase [Candidatus Polarisedimenticolia bacterium]
LKLCIASVADQSGVTYEHIVQDSCSDDDTKDWLPHETRVKAFIEKDSGMYDAVNRGFRRAQGDVLAYLNCDEQYLPGALKSVSDFLDANPNVDAVFADAIVTDPQGNYICHRPALVPGGNSMWVRFPILTCATFVRRHVVQEKQVFFDTQWRDLGDFFWVHEMLTRGVRMEVLPQFTSVFVDTGDNMGQKPNALRERDLKWRMAPPMVRATSYFFLFQHRLRLALRPGVRKKPFDFAAYTPASPDRRVTLRADHPTTFWKGRLTAGAVMNPGRN